MFRIYYDNIDAFAGISLVPLVSRDLGSIDYNQKHCFVESFTLDGRIIASCDGDNFVELLEKKDRLLRAFSRQYKNFYIQDGTDTPIYSGSNAIIRSIDFPSSSYSRNLEYSIKLDVYKSGLFSGTFGILDPNDEINISEDSDGSISVSRSISAVGFNTENSAIDNALSYVNSISGSNNISINPLFVDPSYTGGLILKSYSQNIDRLAGSISLNQNFIYDKCFTGGYTGTVFKYTTEVASGQGEGTVNVNGNFEGGINTTLSQLRDSYNLFNRYSAAQEAYTGAGGAGSLYSFPISLNVNESAINKTLSFSSLFSDKPLTGIAIRDQFTVSRDLFKNQYCATANVGISYLNGSSSERWSGVNDYYSTFDIKNYIVSKWNEYGYAPSGTLSGQLKQKQVTFDRQNNSIQVGGTLCDKKYAIPSGFEDFIYSASISPALPKFIEHEGIEQEGDKEIQKLIGLTRKRVTIQGTAIASDCYDRASGISNLYAGINAIRDEYLSGSDKILTAASLTTGTAEKKNIYNFNYTWACKETGSIFSSGQINSSVT